MRKNGHCQLSKSELSQLLAGPVKRVACIQVLGEVVENQEQPPKALRRPTGRRLTLIYEAWIRARRCPSNHLVSFQH
ncbi:hypothetical protein M758_11G156400 [Ceratodon purpureus]|nr:hypothetical protein M758_11G156400 [Ceratodon purpureus]